VDILLGKRTPKVEQFDHQSLTVFGVGTELGEGEWRGVIRQMLAQGLLEVEGTYQAYVLTDAGRVVMRGEQEVRLRRDPEKATRTRTRSAKGPQVELPAEAAAVFERLRAWRGATAKEQGVPAYVIFHDATLREIATRTPATLAELGTISGIGEGKLAKYGEGVLATLAG
jgi:ATP-dependent DNA helicase RecQ